MLKLFAICLIILCLPLTTAVASEISVPLYFTTDQGVGKPVGVVVISETKYGLLFTPNLHHLTPGIHGFHIHENPSCNVKGMEAGGHFDPRNTEKHLGPYNDDGHLGDLPVLYVKQDGTVTLPVLAPRIKRVKDIKNHSLMIHVGGDNYSDTPVQLGGGWWKNGLRNNKIEHVR